MLIDHHLQNNAVTAFQHSFLRFVAMKGLFYFTLILLFVRCTPSQRIQQPAGQSISGLRFLDEFILPGATDYHGTIIGGLSGIDYDAKRNLYYMICDDPSSRGPARYYTATIPIRSNRIDTVEIVNMTPLLNPLGAPYADITKDRLHSADTESMRYDQKNDVMIWTSEGQRFIRDGKQELQDPQIVIMNRNGKYRDSFPLPAHLHVSLAEKGPRHNSVFEGIAFDEHYQHVYVSLEEPLYEDGPRAGGGDSTAWIRILKFNRKLRQLVAEYAYQVGPVPYPSIPPTAFKINGVSDILYAGNNKLLIVERGYSVGRIPSDIRIFISDMSDAEDISGKSLAATPPQKPLTRKLLLDLNAGGRFIDNVEGITFGPVLPNGNRTMLMVTDDNFDKKQKMQFLLYEVIP